MAHSKAVVFGDGGDLVFAANGDGWRVMVDTGAGRYAVGIDAVAMSDILELGGYSMIPVGTGAIHIEYDGDIGLSTSTPNARINVTTPEEWQPPASFWAGLPPEYQWIARDADGSNHAYRAKPTLSSSSWDCGNDACLGLRPEAIPTYVPWQESLRQRPAATGSGLIERVY